MLDYRRPDFRKLPLETYECRGDIHDLHSIVRHATGRREEREAGLEYRAVTIIPEPLVYLCWSSGDRRALPGPGGGGDGGVMRCGEKGDMAVAGREMLLIWWRGWKK
ncbi:hypothetical protein E2C01_073049 [Portunus trituberculatus]|uniref:Uncharacterized protein n=1 Tax=Portunus trituberculatus TaxID=210409 RepID=A0A5B7HZR3_PORTR|nr:hypothetical protein [Portunus trituberculatus]